MLPYAASGRKGLRPAWGTSGPEAFARAALAFEKATGQAVSKTVAQFAELGRSPVEASVKLNEQMNYLTADIYKQIKALEDQGRATAAACDCLVPGPG